MRREQPRLSNSVDAPMALIRAYPVDASRDQRSLKAGQSRRPAVTGESKYFWRSKPQSHCGSWCAMADRPGTS